MNTPSGAGIKRKPKRRDPRAVSVSGIQIQISSVLVDEAWDSFLRETPGGHHVQTSLWAQVKADRGWRTTRIIAFEDDQIVGGAQILLRDTQPLGTIGYVTKGPVFAQDDQGLVDQLFAAIHQAARKHQVKYLSVQPPNNGHTITAQMEGWGFHPSAIQIAPTASVVVDLQRDEDQIFSEMRKKTRQYIRRGEREGLIVRAGTVEDLRTFYELLEKASRRLNYTTYPFDYFEKMWETFEPHGQIKLFIAEYRSEPLTALLTIPFGETVLTKVIGWSGRAAQLRPNLAVDWAAIQWARSKGYRYYDLEGIDTNAAAALNRGEDLPQEYTRTATFYKLGFGGQVMLFPSAYDIVYNPLFKHAYRLLSPFIANSDLFKRALQRFRTV